MANPRKMLRIRIIFAEEDKPSLLGSGRRTSKPISESKYGIVKSTHLCSRSYSIDMSPIAPSYFCTPYIHVRGPFINMIHSCKRPYLDKKISK